MKVLRLLEDSKSESQTPESLNSTRLPADSTTRARVQPQPDPPGCPGQDPRIHLSESDFLALTLDGALLNPSGEIGPAEFETIMRRELHAYAQARPLII
jgi:hypothetical protein